MDGPCINEGVGVAAAVQKRYRGSNHSQVSGEGNRTHCLRSGINRVNHEILRAHLADKVTSESRTTIGVDNQAAISTLLADKQMAGQRLVDSLQKALEALSTCSSRHCQMDPGTQIRIKGNETADEEAKKASKGKSSPRIALPPSLIAEIPTNKPLCYWPTSQMSNRVLPILQESSQNGRHRSLHANKGPMAEQTSQKDTRHCSSSYSQDTSHPTTYTFIELGRQCRGSMLCLRGTCICIAWMKPHQGKISMKKTRL